MPQIITPKLDTEAILEVYFYKAIFVWRKIRSCLRVIEEEGIV